MGLTFFTKIRKHWKRYPSNGNSASITCRKKLLYGLDFNSIETVFVIACLTLVAIPPVRLDQNGCESISPPCPLNARLSVLVNNNSSGYKIQCDEGFELFGDVEVTCSKGKTSSGYCATNVATNRPTNQSSTASTTASASNTSSGKQLPHFANDGLINTCSQTLKELNPFWKIDLLQNHHVTGIKISMGDSASMSQSVDLEVRVGNNPLGLKNPLCVWQPASEFLPDEKKLFSCARPIQGRYLSIQIIGSESALKLCEVEVFATDGIPSQRCFPESTVSEDIVSFNGSCFEFATKTNGQTFSGARSQCVARRGDLPTENHLKANSPNQHLIITTLERLKPTLKRHLFWIGVERDPGFTSRTWRWVDSGLVAKKPNWGKDQPNNYNGEQNCAALDGGKDWTWNDVGCGLDLLHWICIFPPKKCGSPDRQEGTEISATNDEYLIGTVLTYKCSKPGYFIDSGNMKRTCMPNGLYNGTAPSCKFADCGDGPLKGQLENGVITLPENGSTYFGVNILYKCSEGYTLSGDEKRSCKKDGKWSGSEPKCLKSTCSDPTDIVNGTFKATGKEAGSIVTYSCNEGHVLIGSSVIRCQLGGIYDSPPPICKYISCGELPKLHNGSFTLEKDSENKQSGAEDSTMLGTIASGSCDLNFELSDESYSKIVCGERGHWELMGNFGSRTPLWSSLIKCQLIFCGEPEVPTGSFVTGYDFSVGSEIQYHCEEGHIMVGGTEIRRCTLKKTWSGIAPLCKYIDCGRAQTTPFGQVTYPSGKTYLDSTVEYSCAPNYRLSGPGTRTCTAGGTWSGSTPKCEEIRCAFPELPPSSVVTVAKNDRFSTQPLITAETASQQNLNSTFRIGTVLKLRCERGYVLEGDKMQTCESGGVWMVREKPQCKYVDCGEPPSIPNGLKQLISNTTFFGSDIIYECMTGYKLRGVPRRKCADNGTWTGYDELPRCEEQTNATVEYTSHQVGALAKYSCGKGQYLSGETTRTCSEFGFWTGKSSVCHFVKCPPPPKATNARQFLVNVSAVYSAMVEFHCVPGYSISPGQLSVLTCSEFGKWDPPTPPTCLNHEEFTAVSKRQNESQSSSDSSGSSVVGIIIGLAIGFAIVTGALFYLLWHIRQRRGGKGGDGHRRTNNEPTKGEPMVVFPTPTSTPTFQSIGQQHYYDNPTIDPIYENLDDYGVTSSSSDVVTINGVSVS